MERTRFFLEMQTFRPPKVLLSVPTRLFENKLLFNKILYSDTARSDPGFDVELLGDFEAGDEYWQALVEAASWLIEIDASKKNAVDYLISPTKRYLKDVPKTKPQHYSVEYPGTADGPRFRARILIRVGSGGIKSSQRKWVGRMSGIRVYMEGFRVLPYGEPSDDWLELDADYKRRDRTLRYLSDYEFDGDVVDEEEGLNVLGNSSYFGSVFLTQKNSGKLRSLVNREGFVPEAPFDTIKDIVRIGIDLSVRTTAASTFKRRRERRDLRAKRHTSKDSALALKQQVEYKVAHAQELAKQARRAASAGQMRKATRLVTEAASQFKEGSDVSDRLLTEPSMTRMLAAIGTQMASFVHEMNALLGIANSIETSIDRLRSRTEFSVNVRRSLGRLASSVGDLRRVVERQAAYLSDITSPDARRRRSRQSIHNRVDASIRLVVPVAERLKVQIRNKVPEDLKSPAMFPAELTLIFSNLLTNAVKAAGKSGKIQITARDSKGILTVRVENTGKRMNLSTSDKWFRPFESTSTRPDPYLGQGMGMGLPLTRNMLEEYGAEIRFAAPRKGFSTAVQITFN